MKNLAIKAIGLTAIASISTFIAFAPQKLAAQSTTSAYSGVCAGIFNLANGYEVAAKQSASSMEDESINASMQIDFSTNKATVIVNDGGYRNGGATYRLKVASNKDMVLTDYPQMSGTKKAIITAAELGGAVEFLIIPVNSGNTLLIQGLNFGASGICQKV